MSLYLYGVIPQSAGIEFGPIGFGGEAVRAIPVGTFAAVIGPAPREVFSNIHKEELVRMLLTHQATLEEVMKRFFVLPFKFGTTIQDESELFWILESNGRRLAGLLEQMKGCVEIDVVATWDVKQMLLEISEEDPEIARIKKEMAADDDTNRAFAGMLLADALKHRADDWRKKISRSLKPHAAGQADHDLLNDAMVLNSSFLIRKEKEKEFFQAVEEVDGQFKGKLHIKCVGPLPPYSFATITLKRFDPHRVREAALLLGLNGRAEIDQAKKNYKVLSQEVHPDRNPDIRPEEFDRLNKAYELLADYCKEGDRSIEAEAIQRYTRIEAIGVEGRG